MKKIIAMLLAAMMLVTLFAGCGGIGGGGGSDTTTVAGDDYELVEINGYEYKKYNDMTKDKITLTYMHFDQDETVQYLANRFTEIYPNITVNAVYENDTHN